MSFPELENWNPMEEEYRKNFSRSSDRNNISDLDLLCLYVRQVPPDLTRDKFSSLMAGNNRTVTEIHLNKKCSPNNKFTYGFAHFATHAEALDAMNELNESPPHYFKISFAKKRADSEDKVNANFENPQNTSKGRGMHNNNECFKPSVNSDFENPRNASKGRGMHNNEYAKSNVNSNIRNAPISSRGRGMRIDLEGSKSITHKLKVTTGGSGRTVTVGSPAKFPTKKSVPVTDGQFSDARSPIQNACKSPVVSPPNRCDARKQDVTTTLVPNPFYFCFHCGKDGRLSCRYCRKPYCSQKCQSADSMSHQQICKKAKGVMESLLGFYKNSQSLQNNDSSYMSENSNSGYETPSEDINRHSVYISKAFEEECTPVAEFLISPGQTEMVSVIRTENPSKFWVHLKKFSQEFLKMEEELLQKNLKSFSSASCVTPELNCCTLWSNKMCRAEVLKVKSQNEILINFFDYGKIVTVQKSALCNLPREFRKLPKQAILCKLVGDSKKGNILWNDEDSECFQIHTSNKTYKAHFLKCVDNIHEVSLINEDGITLYSMLVEEKEPSLHISKSVPQASEIDGPPPSIWFKMKPGAKMHLVPSIMSENSIWCYLSTNDGSDLGEILEIEKLLQNYSGKDITLCAEEGDFAAGFSDEYKQFYRCIILKRKRESFLVRYIDYGNEEEVTRLCTLSPEIYQKCSYLIKCEKPSSVTIDDFKKCIGDTGVEVGVLKVDRNAAILSFNSGKEYSVVCYPCYPNLETEDEFSHASVPATNNINSVYESSSVHVSSPGNVNSVHKENSAKIIAPKVLSQTETYDVKVAYIKTVSELYIQVIKDETEMIKMMESLNQFCNSRSVKHVPSIGEVVSCKFSDGVWYRGQVKKKLGDKYHVFFVDYGNEDIILQNNIQILPEKFISPRFGICVSLSGIKNENVTMCLLSKIVEESWQMKVINDQTVPIEVMLFQEGCSLSDMIDNKRKKTALNFQKLPNETEVKVCFEDNYVYVNQIKDLKDLEKMSAKLNSLSGLLIPKKPVINNVYCGLFDDGLWYRVSIEKEVSPGEYKVYFLDFGNYGNACVNDLREIPDDIFALPVYCIPVVVQNRLEVVLNLENQYYCTVVGIEGGVQKVKLLLKDHRISDDTSNQKNKSGLTFKKLPTEETDIKICHEDDKYVYLHQVQDLKTVENLFVKLNSLSELPAVKKPVVNNVYCGLFMDGSWYRVCVEEEVSSDAYKVFFLDYGNCEILSIDNLRELPSDLFSMDVCCVPVVIENRGELTDLNTKDVYCVRVTGMQDEIQKIKLTTERTSDSSDINSGADSEKSKSNYEEIEKLPHVSAFKRQHLEDGLNVVKFCHVEGDTFYCQLSSDSDCILGIFKILQQCGREGEIAGCLSNGNVICAKSSDNLWYRASVISDKKAPLYKVLFLDYGNIETVTGDCVKILPAELTELPVFAIPVKINNLDQIRDTEVYTKPILVKKIKVLEDNVHLVEIQIEEDTNIPKVSTLKKETLPSNCISNVIVCHIEGDIYYVQLVSNVNNLTELESQLANADIFSALSHPPEVDDVICAKFTDGAWYRCAVQEVHSDKMKVCFIDYGNSDFVSMENVKVLPPELFSYSVSCIPIKFNDENAVKNHLSGGNCPINIKVCGSSNNIHLVDIISDADIFNQSPAKTVVTYNPTFVSSLKSSSLLLKEPCKVIFKSHVGNLYVVVKSDDIPEMQKLSSLLQESKTDTISHLPSVNEILIAKRKDNLWYRCCVEAAGSGKDTYKVYFTDLGITEDVQKSLMHCLPENCVTYPLFAIKVSVESEESIMIDRCYTVQASKQNPDSVYYVKVYHQYMFSSISHKELPPNKECSVIFYHKENGKLFLQDTADIQKVVEVQSALAEYSSSTSIPYKPVVGELVCAKSQLDNAWYRGCVQEILSADKYKVFFIDYGNCEDVEKTNILAIPLALTKFPSLCVEVKFASGNTAESIELEKVYTVITESKVSNNVQVIKLCGVENAGNSKKVDNVKAVNSSNDAEKFSFTSCKNVPFYPGNQDIVIYNVDEEGFVFCAPHSSENIETNIGLPRLLTEYCNTEGIPFNNNCQPELDDMVLALYPEDGMWYRAAVIDKSHPTYDVNFVDFGNTEHLDISSLRKMSKEFMKYDIQAHMCSLTGFRVPDENLKKVYQELKRFIVFDHQNPLRALVQVVDGEIIADIPEITSWLVEKNLVIAT